MRRSLQGQEDLRPSGDLHMQKGPEGQPGPALSAFVLSRLTCKGPRLFGQVRGMLRSALGRGHPWGIRGVPAKPLLCPDGLQGGHTRTNTQNLSEKPRRGGTSSGVTGVCPGTGEENAARLSKTGVPQEQAEPTLPRSGGLRGAPSHPVRTQR